jgi:UDP-glucose 4-epimerase
LTARILVTGGAGFIGSHLVDRLVEEGSSVTVLDDLSTGRRENLGATGRDAVHFVEGSVLDETLVDKLVDGVAVVYHLAAAVGVRHIVRDPVASSLTNVRGTETVLAAALRHGARLLLASTSEVYGRSQDVPFREDGPRVLGPTWVHRWSYSTAKALDEHLAFGYLDRGLRVSIVRYFNSYGPRLDETGYGSVVARFMSQALSGRPLTVHGDGQQTRCFTYVTDTVEGTVRAATMDAAVGRVMNIGSPRETTIRRLAELVREVAGSDSEIISVPYEVDFPTGFEDTRRRVPDTSLARGLLGWDAAVDLDEGLRATVAWCRDHYSGAGRRA